VKIALLIPSLDLGGSERNIVLLGEVLSEAGCAVEIWLTGSDKRELATVLPVVVMTPPARGGNRAFAIVRRVGGIRHNIRRFQPACMISFLESSNIPALFAGVTTRVPTVVSVRGNPQRFNWFYRIMALTLYRRARSVVLPSREVARYLARHYLLRNTACIPNIHSCDGAADVAPTRKMLAPMIAVGRFVRGKRFDEVIELAENLNTGRELVIVGDGPERDALRTRAASASITVRFAGSLPHREVLQQVATASVLLSMSVSECWPNAIAEALAVGTPVIARDCNFGPREMITDGVNGWLIRSATDGKVRTDIRPALADADTYAALCNGARDRARAWSRERVRELWLTQLQGAAA
jgi:GalNAc-alpha-(1->4)-GalNAc-alpha-(1->3)-diNAcBac-PP-undecaprenol alpha-1,4-N-acetyl-D-galactosaminyltransferase